MEFTNMTALQVALIMKMQAAMQVVLDNIRDELEADMINMSIGESSMWYESTGEFEKAWSDMIEQNATEIIGTFYYDASKITTFNPDLYQHASPYGIAAEGLADIVFNGLSAEHSMFGEIPARNAWGQMIEKITPKINIWFQEALNNLGVDTTYNITML